MIIHLKKSVFVPLSWTLAFSTLSFFSCSNNADMAKKKQSEHPMDAQMPSKNVGTTDSLGHSTLPTSTLPDSTKPLPDDSGVVPIGIPTSRGVYDKMKKDAEKPNPKKTKKKSSTSKEDGQQDN